MFYKNDFASGAALLSLYMIYGGTNWGNLGHAGGYTSYDYGASITENRELYREKYSEVKLEANFLKVSPSFLTVSVGNLSNGTYASTTDIATTPLYGTESIGNYYIIRQAAFASLSSISYTLVNISTSLGYLNIPQLNGTLSLNGRDSKWFVTDYDVGGTDLLYSTAEIFTWKVVGDKTFLVVYGGPNELHELAVVTSSPAQIIEGSGVTTKSINETTILNWEVTAERKVVQLGSLFIYILDRNTAYNYWVPDFERSDVWANYSSNLGNLSSVIIEAGYLIRSVALSGTSLSIHGDLNATVPLKVIGAPSNVSSLLFNGETVNATKNSVTGEWSSTLTYIVPTIDIPDLSSLNWKYLDNLPEVQSTYDDSLWTTANLTVTPNPVRNLTTPVSLYSSDYGYHTGVLLYRGHFTASGNESSLYLRTIGGSAFGSSVWLNSTYIGSWGGIDKDEDNNSTYTLPNLVAGKPYVLTVVVDNNGLDESGYVGNDGMKTPRGILDYNIDGLQSGFTWKLTGNLDGEKYIDKVRGPLNEGGLYAERQGYTQPSPPSDSWDAGSPLTGITSAGVAFYSTSFTLDLPKGYDVPLAFNFGNSTANGTSHYRAQLWVNGYQFGKYVNNIGPQSSFPVPQGILNYYGENWLAVELWAQQAQGAALTNFTLEAGVPVLTSYAAPEPAPQPAYSPRAGAY